MIRKTNLKDMDLFLEPDDGTGVRFGWASTKFHQISLRAIQENGEWIFDIPILKDTDIDGDDLIERLKGLL
jgi:hypothetical protein